MKNWIKIAATIPALWGQVAYPCTTVQLTAPSDAIVAKSYDYLSHDGHVLINKRHVAKVGVIPEGKGKPAAWVSHYGSVTFNQFGREFPIGGMNEKGLVVEIMVLDETKYPAPSVKIGAVNEAQWIQYQLDNFATVAEMVKAANKVNVVPFAIKTHYMACDALKECATFEYINGKAVIHQGDKLKLAGKKVPVLTNDTYAKSRTYLKGFAGFGGKKPLPSKTDSLDRFAIAAIMGRDKNGAKNPVNHALSILDKVHQDTTVWNMVYNSTKQTVHFRSEKNRAVKELAFKDFDFSCSTPALYLPINDAKSRSLVSQFAPASTAANYALIENTVKILPNRFPSELLQALAAYPEKGTSCVENTAKK